MSMPDPNEERMYDDTIAGNPTVNETQVRRAGRAIDDQVAVDALQAGDVEGAGSVQRGQVTRERRDDDTSANRTASAENARESKSQTGKTQSQRTGM